MIQDYLTSIESIEFEVGENSYAVNNYTNLLDISSILEKYKDYIRVIKIGEDERLERLSFRLYSTMKYWDTILILNGITSILQLPTSYDRVLERAEERYEEWEKEFGNRSTEEQKEYRKAEFLELENIRNEKYRDIKYIDPSMISNFDLDVRNYKRDLLRDSE